MLLTPSRVQPAKEVQFAHLSKSLQEDFALMAWHRVAQPEDLGGVFSLAAWQDPIELGESMRRGW